MEEKRLIMVTVAETFKGKARITEKFEIESEFEREEDTKIQKVIENCLKKN